jgi:hypothetical protein
MVTYRCTERVRKRFKLKARTDVSSAPTVLGDWYANLLNHGPDRHVFRVSERTLLPLIIPARNGEFPGRVGQYLSELLQYYGVPSPKIEAEVAGMGDYQIAKTQSRRVLGVLNEYVMLATYHMPEESRLLASLRLSETPLGPFGGEAADQRICDAFGLPRRRDWWWSNIRPGPHVG